GSRDVRPLPAPSRPPPSTPGASPGAGRSCTERRPDPGLAATEGRPEFAAPTDDRPHAWSRPHHIADLAPSSCSTRAFHLPTAGCFLLRAGDGDGVGGQRPDAAEGVGHD